jgi:hypothetical protein
MRHPEDSREVNPATGLPMTTPGRSGVDLDGNPYGAGRLEYEPIDWPESSQLDLSSDW